MDNGSQTTMTIDRMPEGGYLVVSGYGRDDFAGPRRPVFACTDIDAALAFIRDKVKPIPATQEAGRG